MPVIFFGLKEADILKNLINLDKLKKNKRCQHQEKAASEYWDGIILEKYEDRKNHNIRTLVLKNTENRPIKITELAIDRSDLYDKLKVGDYIKKKQGELIVRVVSDSTESLTRLDYDCKE
ncbi:hypothetical protein QQ008_00950 [Fulvivirgaceae bacterium BMA10]|uniref:Uncharacterized protein n=2 Tax=Splendidivirga corallicola TaxID=3051826 RepID=A0ABT8KGQ3_9BACT|nr:hypothetical protein [Fulvivirgaceae bacterium BMA10]